MAEKHRPVGYHRNGRPTWSLWCEDCDWSLTIRQGLWRRLLRRLDHADRPTKFDAELDAHGRVNK